MKKFLAIVVSVMMVLSVGFSSAIVASAATSYQSNQTTPDTIQTSATVNGAATADIKVKVDPNNPKKVTFKYTGTGTVNKWNFYDGNGALLTEGVDYTVVVDPNTATVTVVSNVEKIVADAIIGSAKPVKPTKPNKGNQSPNTGAMGLTGLAVAGAGVAVLTAMKRKSDAE